MAGFIEDFYYGNIDPQARSARTDTAVRKEMQRLSDFEEEMTNQLIGEEKRKFLAYVNAWGVVRRRKSRQFYHRISPRSSFCAGHVSFGQRSVHRFLEGGITMRKSKRKYFYLDDFEHRLLVGCLMTARNEYIYEDKPIEDVNELILKIIDAPTKKLRVIVKEDA